MKILILIVILVLLVIIFGFGTSSFFLLREMKKKFGFMSQYVKSSKQVLTYDHKGNMDEMVQVVITWDEPFTVLVGFELTLFGDKGFDYFGCVESKEEEGGHHVVVIETYFGKGPATFLFLLNQSFGEHAPILEVVPKGTHQPTVTYPPHWFQKL